MASVGADRMFSFTARKKQTDICAYLRRICDLTTPMYPLPVGEARAENRYNRSIPVVLCPVEKGSLARGDWEYAVTRDVCDRGVGVILRHPFEAEEAVVGFWMRSDELDEPWFFRGTTRSNTAIGGGFWLLGVELNEFLNPDHRLELEALFPVAAKLLPPSAPRRVV